MIDKTEAGCLVMEPHARIEIKIEVDTAECHLGAAVMVSEYGDLQLHVCHFPGIDLVRRDRQNALICLLLYLEFNKIIRLEITQRLYLPLFLGDKVRNGSVIG